MCGITGFLTSKPLGRDYAVDTITMMTATLEHRGPDGSGIWYNLQDGIAVGHRRLAVVDLSDAGRQPMESHSKKYTIVFNGEIYNHYDLRQNLVGSYINSRAEIPWAGHSDTEILVNHIECFGIDSTLKQCVGMFAFAVWDRENKVLTLARDRAGEKPLYFSYNNERVIFGSELKALLCYPKFDRELNRESIALQLKYGYIPSPHTIFRGVEKLNPGCYVQFSYKSNLVKSNFCEYWSAVNVVNHAKRNPILGCPASSIKRLDQILNGIIRQQQIADVPIGVLLSGGIDSSTIAGIAQSQRSKPIETFTVQFAQSGYDESEAAGAIAKYIGSNHHNIPFDTKSLASVLQNISEVYDEPFSDPSQIPSIIISRAARKKVVVVLSGEGGDELFCGYNRYLVVSRGYHKNKILSSLLSGVSDFNFINNSGLNILLNKFGYCDGALKVGKFINMFGKKNDADVYKYLLTSCSNASEFVLGIDKFNSIDTIESKWNQLQSVSDVEKMMVLDFMIYLGDGVLTKIDRAAMAIGLESRAPFLDHNLFEFVWRLPQECKLRGKSSKWILKEVQKKYLPSKLICRQKKGFSVPIEKMLRDELCDWADNMLDKTRLKNQGYLDYKIVVRTWEEFKLGDSRKQTILWNILMFQSWLSRYS